MPLTPSAPGPTEIDGYVGRTSLTDGRDAVVIDWYDTEYRMFFRTVQYSVDTHDLPDPIWHRQLLLDSHLIAQEWAGRGIGLKQLADSSGKAAWSATIVSEETP